MSQAEADDIVRRMLPFLEHRGPDDEGLNSWGYPGGAVAFGHTRLSILDLSSNGHQPMTDRSERYWTVFNGEIYNNTDLRAQLNPNGELFRSSTDTESILHAYDQWGEESFARLRGMFAFALFDRRAGTMHLVRDPLGIKPLYYFRDRGRLIFASEIRALLATGLVPRTVNLNAICEVLTYGSVCESGSAVDRVESLKPGHALKITLHDGPAAPILSTYEAPLTEKEHVPSADRTRAMAELSHTLKESVKCHLISDVPVGLFLSGGIDSTAILHLMQLGGHKAPKTFTVGFADTQLNEAHIAKRVAEQYGTEHSEILLSDTDLIRQLPAALAAMDQPTMDGINSYVVASAVHQAGIKVALSGLGADELFAGYPSFERLRWAALAAQVPNSVRTFCARLGGRIKTGPKYDKMWALLKSDCSVVSAYQISRRLFDSRELCSLVPGQPVAELVEQLPLNGDAVNNMTRLEMGGYMKNVLLRDTDFMSMASSLEVRLPFVDKIVLRHVLRLAGSWKVDGSRQKSMLLDALNNVIPDYVWNRNKMGFVLPFDRWIRSTLRSEVEETLMCASLNESIGLAPNAVRQVWKSYLDDQVRWSKPWTLFVLLRWCQQHKVSI